MPGALRSVREPSSRYALSLLAAIILLGGALRLYLIGAKGLWLDEAFSVWLGRHPLEQMWGWIASIDQHPPLYYTLLQLWMRLGNDASTVRALSAMISTLTIPIIFLLGRRLVGSLVGLLAALILAVSPFNVRFAQETRMYALLAFCASMAMLCLAYLLEGRDYDTERGRHREWERRRHGEGKRRRVAALPRVDVTVLPWIGYVVFTTAALLTHSTAVLLLVAMNLFVFGLMLRPVGSKRLALSAPLGSYGAGQAASTQTASTVGSAAPPGQAAHPCRQPAGLSMASGPAGTENGEYGHSGNANGLQPPAWRNWLLGQAIVVLLWGIVWLRPSITQVSGVYRDFWLPSPTWLTVIDALGNFLSAHLPRQQMPWADVIWPVYLALCALGIVYLHRRPGVIGLLLTLFLTPVAIELLVSLRRPIFYDRTLIWATIPLYVLLAAGIAALRRPPAMLGAVAMVVTFAGLSLHGYYTNFQKEEWKEAAADVSSQVRDGDLILFNASWVQIPFDFYFSDGSRLVAEHGLPADLFDRGVLESKMAETDLPMLRELTRNRERVWLVYSHHWYTDPDGLITTTLPETLHLTQTREFEGLEIRLYTRPLE